MRLIDADSLYERLKADEERAMGRVIDTPSSFPNGAVNLSAIKYMAQLSERTRFKEIVYDAPTIDAVEVVRCKDCENWDTEWQPVLCKSNRVVHYCPILDRVTAEDMFCAYGERKSE